MARRVKLIDVKRDKDGKLIGGKLVDAGPIPKRRGVFLWDDDFQSFVIVPAQTGELVEYLRGDHPNRVEVGNRLVGKLKRGRGKPKSKFWEWVFRDVLPEHTAQAKRDGLRSPAKKAAEITSKWLKDEYGIDRTPEQILNRKRRGKKKKK